MSILITYTAHVVGLIDAHNVAYNVMYGTMVQCHDIVNTQFCL